MPKPNHPAKPTSQQVPGVEPLSDEGAYYIKNYLSLTSPLRLPLLQIETGHHVVISATELSALRAREERLRLFVDGLSEFGNARVDYVRKELASILNEGKT